LRAISIVLLALSPNTVNTPNCEEKTAVTASSLRDSNGSRNGTNDFARLRRAAAPRREPRTEYLMNNLPKESMGLPFARVGCNESGESADAPF
jgi:hypothetical protein